MKNLKKGHSFGLALVFGVLCLMQNAHADQKFRPASFSHDALELIEGIQFSTKLEKISGEIKCSATVNEHGKLSSKRCSVGKGGSAAWKVRKSLLRTLRKIKAEPAMVNDSPISVILNFRVVLKKDSKGSELRLYPNQGWDSRKYGDDYTQAQQYKDGHRGRAGCHAGETKFVLKLVISDTGLPNQIDVVQSESLKESCKKGFVDDLAQDKYLPAFVNGKPVESNTFLFIDF